MNDEATGGRGVDGTDPGRGERRGHDGRRGDRQRPPARERSAQHRSAARPSERSRRADPARLAAYTLMRAVDDGAYANLVLPRIIRDAGLSGRDAGFATELAYGATRMSGLYDAVIGLVAERPLDRIDNRVLDTLRIGAHQVLAMRVPAHAAVDETVALARHVNGAGAAGFVNAVTRRISERTREEWLDAVTEKETDPVAALAVRTSHPRWITKALRSALIGHGRVTGDEVLPELEKLLDSDNEPAKVALVARPGLADVEELFDAGAIAAESSPIGAILVDGGDPGTLAAVREGRAAVQDEGSQLLALALAEAEVTGDAATHERWLDLCAGPGGKAGLLAAIAVQRRIPFVANEVSEHRADLVRRTLTAASDAADAAGTTVEVTEDDGRDVGRASPAAYSRVLVDAPCTGLGALRRRPEARWRRTPADVSALANLQRDLLASAIDATMPGGLVAYATCSPHLSETRFVVEDVLKKRDDVEVIDVRGLFRDADGGVLPDLGDGPTVQLWPHVHNTDAMFMALLRRK